MNCPFLKEARVRSCRAAAIRKLIVGNGAPAEGERCSSSKYRECPSYREADASDAPDGRCPLLDEQHVRYCSASSIPHYVPWSEQAGQCGGSGHRYCELWLSVVRPHASGSRDPVVDGIHVPHELWYAPNHLWLHSDEGGYHIGIDEFLARTLAEMKGISFVTGQGVGQPAAVVNVRGVDWVLEFPNRLLITAFNSYLRHAPERLLADPYGAGWLFEGRPAPGETRDVTTGLMDAEQAFEWMRDEVARIAEFVHHLDGNTLNDGGRAADDFSRHLSREDLLRLLHQFFAVRKNRK
jgi:glycine cleavage system H protein